MLTERLTAQLLAGERAGDAVSVAEHLLALQGQNQSGVRMALCAHGAPGCSRPTWTAR
jgi:hypothetical protein